MTASWIVAWMRGLAAMRAPRCTGPAMSRALLFPILDWPCAECGLYHAVFRETQEEPL